MFEAHVVRRATLHELEMLTALHQNVRAVVNPSVLKGEDTIEGGIFVAR